MKASTTSDRFELRLRRLNSAAINETGDYILYWMVAARRTSFNFALDRAIFWAKKLSRPLVVFEPLRVGYPWASDRLHRFVIDGMADKCHIFNNISASYYPYVEPLHGAGKGLLAALAAKACVVVTDDYPCFFLPRMLAAAASSLPVQLEAVDGNGLLPMRSADRAFTAAYHYRRHMQRNLALFVDKAPNAEPLRALDLPTPKGLLEAIQKRWPPASEKLLAGDALALATLPIDHSVPVVPMHGGEVAAHAALAKFVKLALANYKDAHNEPEVEGTSRLSPYLHFGHIGVHEIFHAVMRQEKWSIFKVGPKASGAREGWWGVSEGAEAFLDQLITWRELAFNQCVFRPKDYDRYDSLPAWALETLAKHERDPRPHIYSRAQLEAGQTHDPLWNAAMGQLRTEGWFHNYMRMLWGKKILEWSRTPREALGHMIAIMDRWSLDGRDPNAYAGYFWTLGRYDRPWPERPIYGTVRSMSSDNTARKFPVKRYIAQYASAANSQMSLL
jgi:deoxyribodipyrimidine photo-lyase